MQSSHHVNGHECNATLNEHFLSNISTHEEHYQGMMAPSTFTLHNKYCNLPVCVTNETGKVFAFQKKKKTAATESENKSWKVFVFPNKPMYPLRKYLFNRISHC